MQKSPDPELAEQFAQLESRIDAAVALITRLKDENARLAARLARLEKLRGEAVRRIDTVLDRIDEMT